MKNELIDTQDVSTRNLKHIVKLAQNFFNHYFGGGVECMIINDNQYDLEYHGIELGSYGIRECDFLKWIYGTGCSEPRLSRTLQMHGII